MPIIVTAAGLANRTLLLGAGLLCVDTRTSGADGHLTMEATADVTPLAVGIGANRGLTFLAHTQDD